MRDPRTSGPAPLNRTRVRDLFLRLLGGIFAIAFLSLLVQARLLWGRDGLLPVAEFFDRIAGRAGFLDVPSLFWLGASDAALAAAAAAGVAAGLALAAGYAPRACLAILWALYLSFASVGRDFLSFQWDNLLLETAFFAFLVAPNGVRLRRAGPPHPAAVFLMLWLVFRLNVESGLAKILTGDPTWRDLSAMATYYETAPLPTWLGWYVHQLPLPVHKFCSLFTFIAELAAPMAIWFRSRAIRGAAFAVLLAFQTSIHLTANYGFFNLLSVALLLWLLDDGQLGWILALPRRSLAALRARGGKPAPERGAPAPDEVAPSPGDPAPAPARRAAPLAIAAAALVAALAVIPFFGFVPGLRDDLVPARRILSNWRSMNAYHLFATMTIVRNEVVIEGSEDGSTWRAYEFHFKPGDPTRPPPFVAPHQPRVDFQLWFLLLGGSIPREEYFDSLIERVRSNPRVVAPLFAVDPFPTTPPRWVRVAAYRYRFSDLAGRRATGAWWTRELLGVSEALPRDAAAGVRNPRGGGP